MGTQSTYILRNLGIAGGVTLALILISQFTYLLPIHVGAFMISIAAVLVADWHALGWLVGRTDTIEKRRIERLHQLIKLGLLVIVVSGVLMAYPIIDILLEDPSFLVKMGFVAALIINSVVIGRHMHVASERPFHTLNPKERIPLIISGIVSTISWLSAFAAAQFY